jgi:hypothetical protein
MNNIQGLRLRLAALGAVTAAVVMATSTAATAAPDGQVLGTNNPNAISDSYIVVFHQNAARSGVSALTSQLASKHGAAVEHTYQHALQGFAGTMSASTAKRALR